MVSWPDPVPLGHEGGTPDRALDALIRGPGSALAGVVLVAPAPAGEDARAAALAIARAWVRTGRRVVLVDLGLDQPSLHEPLGLAGEEGIADHFSFGTSLERLARPVDGGEWALIPAGAYTPDAAAVLGSREWRGLLQRAGEQDTTFLLYAPADTPGLAGLAAVVGAVVDLGGARQLERIRPYSVLAAFQGDDSDSDSVTGDDSDSDSGSDADPDSVSDSEPDSEPASEAAPPPAVPAAAAAPERLSEEEYARIRLPKDARSREALIADLRARQRDALMHVPPAPATPGLRPSLAEERGAREQRAAAAPVRPAELAGAWSPEAAAVPEEPTSLGADFPLLEPPPHAPRAAPRRRRPLLYTLVVVALLSLLAAGWHFGGAWLEARRAAREAAAAAAEPVREPVPVEPLPAVDTVLGYAVALEAHQQLPDALRRVTTLRTAMPEPGFFIAPLVREGSLFYHVMAGPVQDGAMAAALMDTLIARRHKTGGTPADVRHAPLAFLAGDYSTPDSAAARIAELEALEVPAYSLSLAGPPIHYRVYVGGYAGTAEAEVMGEILRAVGERDSLVARVGKR